MHAQYFKPLGMGNMNTSNTLCFENWASCEFLTLS
jgi:hypothetical protein